jgi:chemotaxis protein methyltransferase CheR
MRPDEVDFLAELMRTRAGHAIDRDKIYLMESRLGPVARREGFATIREMLGVVRQRGEDRLVWAVVEAMAAGETLFFRDRKPFQTFREDMLPALAKARKGKPIRVLSAGCATGQEPYSLAMIVDEESAALQGQPVEIVGADLSARGLEKAQSGLYTQFEIQRGLPIRLLVKYFERRDESWTLTPGLRARVQWRRVNLHGDISGLGRFDVIFCRNVASQMESAAARRMLDQMAQALPRDGYLVMGAGEQGGAMSESLRPLGASVYAPKPAISAAA